MRKPIVGISLKIYMNRIQPTLDYIEEIKDRLASEEEVELFVFPSMGTLREVGKSLLPTKIGFGAQNIAPLANGALTGEFSVESLIDMEGKYVELGHAERRKNFNETNEMIRQKVELAFENSLTPVLCIGENEAQKERAGEFLEEELRSALTGADPEKVKNLIVAYEPVWAIGQAEAASAEYVHQIHQQLRRIIGKLFTEEIAEQVRLIYGGSVSQETVGEIINDPNVDGVFVGRFGHDPKKFSNIVQIVKNAKKSV